MDRNMSTQVNRRKRRYNGRGEGKGRSNDRDNSKLKEQDLKGREEGEDKDRNKNYATTKHRRRWGTNHYPSEKKNYNSNVMSLIPQTFLHLLHQPTNVFNKIQQNTVHNIQLMTCFGI